ncbi:Thioesterase/thiol ester dehydrase-isomerase [Meredithblackwellia eburnea MCA 4105]
MDLDKALGHVYEPFPVTWNQRDVLLYAAGIGAKRDELSFLYELSKDWHVFPTYPLVCVFKGESQDVVNFAEGQKKGGVPQGLPKTDPNRGLHAEQSIEIIKSIPPVSGDGWSVHKRLVGIKDTGKGLILDSTVELKDPKGETYVRMVTSGYLVGKFNTGGYNKQVVPPVPFKPLAKPPARKADKVFSEKTTEEQAILYRLSGDYNPLHIDPQIGKNINMPGAILHGLASYGHAARALVINVAGSDGRRLKYMSARFTSPVMPGDELETSMWLSTLDNGDIRVDFVQLNKGTSKLSLGGGVAVFAKAQGGSKL